MKKIKILSFLFVSLLVSCGSSTETIKKDDGIKKENPKHKGEIIKIKVPEKLQPKIILNKMPDKSYSRIINIEGRTENLENITIENNSKKINVKVNNNIFSKSVPLKSGLNIITIKGVKNNKAVEIKKEIYFGDTLAAGTAHTGALKNNDIYIWGRNNVKQVNNLDEKEQPISKINTTEKFTSIAFSLNHSMAISDKGELFTWGDNKYKRLGRVTNTKCTKHNLDCGYFAKTDLKNIVQISAGGDHNLALNENGEVYAFGNNNQGQLGIKDVKDSLPVKVQFPERNVEIIQIEAGLENSYAIDSQNRLWAWGAGKQGANGNGENNQDIFVPTLILDDVIQISAGKAHALALKKDGSLWGWGLNFSSQVGERGQDVPEDKQWEENILKPKEIKTEEKIKSIKVEGNTSSFLNDRGEAFFWGLNAKDDGTNIADWLDISRPLKNEELSKSNLKLEEIALGGLHFIAKDEMNFFTWGFNFSGSLGIADLKNARQYDKIFKVELN